MLVFGVPLTCIRVVGVVLRVGVCEVGTSFLFHFCLHLVPGERSRRGGSLSRSCGMCVTYDT